MLSSKSAVALYEIALIAFCHFYVTLDLKSMLYLLWKQWIFLNMQSVSSLVTCFCMGVKQIKEQEYSEFCFFFFFLHFPS